jgi:hypothetical protein
VELVRTRKLSPFRADPNHYLFDPLKAAMIHQRDGEVEEAYWLVFFFVHFGKHAKAGWRYAREIYGRLGEGERWDWAATSADSVGFRAWLHAHQQQLRRPGVPRGFGNHRKRESLDAYSPKGTGEAVESYVRWVAPPRTHQQLMQDSLQQAGGNARSAFDILYRSMDAVTRFGRLARFDYLSMVGKLGLAPIEPGSAYLEGSDGPVKGARLLFEVENRASLADLNAWLVDLDQKLKLDFGLQVLEDALCNWQKSPQEFRPFRG